MCSDWQSLIFTINQYSGGVPTPPPADYQQAIDCLNIIFQFANRSPFPSDQIFWVLLLMVHFAILVAFLISFAALYSSF